MFMALCEDPNILSVILLAKTLLEVLGILIPIFLIIMLSLELSKIVLNPENDVINAAKKKMINKCIAAVAVFFMPLLVDLILVDAGSENHNETSCWINANSSTISDLREIQKAEEELKQQQLAKGKEEAKKNRENLAKKREELGKTAENEAKEKEENAKNASNSSEMIGRVVYYNQQDYPNAIYGPGNLRYGTIKTHGCGPTSAAVVASTFLGAKGHTPIDAEKWICDHKGCYNQGSTWSGISNYLKTLGLKVSPVTHTFFKDDQNKMIKELKTGNSLVIILVRGAPFTTGGHFFVITGVTSNNNFTIAEVNSRKLTDKTWTVNEIINSKPDSFIIISK